MNFKDLQQFLAHFQQTHNEKFGANTSQEVELLMNMTKLTEEVGELAEQMLKYQGRQRSAKGDFNLVDLEDEVADVIIAASMMSVVLEVDIEKAIQRKVEKIKTKRWIDLDL